VLLAHFATQPGDLPDLPAFLGLHRGRLQEAEEGELATRPRGAAFDEAAAEFLAALEGVGDLHPLAQAPLVLILWRRAGLSVPEQVVEPAAWTARRMASAMQVEAEARISRIMAARMLNRLTEMGLVREITRGKRFRLWTANASVAGVR